MKLLLWIVPALFLGSSREFGVSPQPPQRHARDGRVGGVYRVAASGLDANKAFASATGRCTQGRAGSLHAGGRNAPNSRREASESVSVGAPQFREETVYWGRGCERSHSSYGSNGSCRTNGTDATNMIYVRSAVPLTSFLSRWMWPRPRALTSQPNWKYRRILSSERIPKQSITASGAPAHLTTWSGSRAR